MTVKSMIKRLVTGSRIKRHKCKSLRHRLLDENPHCHWCGLKVYHSLKQHGLAASIDHIKSRRECHSQAEYQAQTNQVLSCCDCNSRRNRGEVLVPHPKGFRWGQHFNDRPVSGFVY